MESEWLDTRNQKPRKLGQKRFVTPGSAFPPAGCESPVKRFRSFQIERWRKRNGGTREREKRR